MNKKLLIVFLCLTILFVQYIQLHSLSAIDSKEDVHIFNVETKNNITKIGEKQELFFSIKNSSEYSVKKINIKLESSFTVDSENFIIDELKPNEEYSETTFFYILDNSSEKKIKFIVTYTDINNDLKKCEFDNKIDIKVDMMDQYSKIIPFVCLFFIFWCMFGISYKLIIEYRKKHLKEDEEIPPMHHWKDH